MGSLVGVDDTQIKDVAEGDIVKGKIKRKETFGLFITIKGTNLVGLAHKKQLGDSKATTLDSFNEGDKIPRAKVLKVENNKIFLSLKPSCFEDEEDNTSTKNEDEDSVVDSEDEFLNMTKLMEQRKEADKSDDDDSDSEAGAPWTLARKKLDAETKERLLCDKQKREEFKAAMEAGDDPIDEDTKEEKEENESEAAHDDKKGDESEKIMNDDEMEGILADLNLQKENKKKKK